MPIDSADTDPFAGPSMESIPGHINISGNKLEPIEAENEESQIKLRSKRVSRDMILIDEANISANVTGEVLV